MNASMAKDENISLRPLMLVIDTNINSKHMCEALAESKGIFQRDL